MNKLVRKELSRCYIFYLNLINQAPQNAVPLYADEDYRKRSDKASSCAIPLPNPYFQSILQHDHGHGHGQQEIGA